MLKKLKIIDDSSMNRKFSRNQIWTDRAWTSWSKGSSEAKRNKQISLKTPLLAGYSYMLAAHHRLTNKFTGHKHTKKNWKSYKILKRTGNFQEIKFGLTPPQKKNHRNKTINTYIKDHTNNSKLVTFTNHSTVPNNCLNNG